MELKETQNHLRFTEKLNNKKEGMYMNGRLYNQLEQKIK